MAYTRSWSSTTPLGSDAARTIDDSIRAKTLDIEERINSILADDTDIDTDPLVINPERIGAGPVTPQLRQILFSYAHLKGRDDGNRWDLNGGYCDVDFGTQGPVMGGIVIPVGYKIVLFEAWTDKATLATSMETKLFGYRMSTGANVLSTTLTNTSATAGPTIATSAALDYDVTDVDVFSIHVLGYTSFSGRGKFYGARITCQIPNYSLGY